MTNLERWVDALSAEFGFDRDSIDITAILGMTSEVAHNVERPAAPLTAYVAGFLAGGGGAGPGGDAVMDRITDLALHWQREAELPLDDAGA